MKNEIQEARGGCGVRAGDKRRGGLAVLSLLCALSAVGCGGEPGVQGGPKQEAAAVLGLSPSNPQVAQGTVQPFTVRGLFADGRSEDVTAKVRFSVRDEAGRSIAARPEGLPFERPGRYTVTAEYAGRSLSTPVTVTAATLSSIAVSPRTPKVPRGLTKQFTVTAKYSDGTTQDVTGTATWSVKDTVGIDVALIDSTGLVTARSIGEARVQARYQTKTSYTTMEVTAPARTALVISPSNPSIAKGTSIPFSATATYSDGSSGDVTAQVIWGVGDVDGTGVAAIGSGGVAFAKAMGRARISAELDGDMAETQLTVTAAAVVSIGITPGSASVPKGTSQRFAALATLSDGATQDVTAVAAWSAADLSGTGVASVDSTGVARGNQIGKARITCSYGGRSAEAQLQVTPAELAGLSLEPKSVKLALGLGTKLSAIGQFTDGSQQDVSALTMWSVTDLIGSGVASIDLGGRVQSKARGTARVTATFGTQTASATVEVTAAAVTSLSVSPSSWSLSRTGSKQLVATALLSDGSMQDVSASATWTAIDVTGTGVASVDSKGLVTARADGVAAITATFQIFIATAQITVNTFRTIPTGVTGYLWGIYSSSPDDVWVVGVDGAALHFDGMTWSRVSFTTENLLSIWGSGRDDIWVGGYSGRTFHYDGTRWTQITIPGLLTGEVYGFVRAGASELWASNGRQVARWNGTSWSSDTVSTDTIYGIWSSGPSDIWTAGANGTIYRHDGTRWSSVPSTVTSTFWGLGGSGPRDVWAVGLNGTVVHWDGTRFSKVTSGTSQHLVSVASVGAGEAWITGWGATLLRWNGSVWSPVNSGVSKNLMGVLPTPTSLWITGWEGTLLQR